MKIIFALILITTVFDLSIAQEKTNFKKNSTTTEINLITQNLIESNLYEKSLAEKIIISRIEKGIYDGQEIKIRDANLKLTSQEWNKFSPNLKQEVLYSIVSNTWGNSSRLNNPLYVRFKNGQNPLDILNSKTNEVFATFSKKEYLRGGKGQDAYGPNCWYTTVSSIGNSNLWTLPRFMGAAEFRCFTKKMKKITDPKFGDIVRYYTDLIYYDESNRIYNGEVHAAIFIGKDSIGNIVLIKNGRNDLNFLIFQYEKDLDNLYLSESNESKIVKNYFRLKENLILNDPNICQKCSDCYEDFQIDLENYKNRFDCLSGKIQPDIKIQSCYDYPVTWRKE